MESYLHLVGTLDYMVIGSDVTVFCHDDTGACTLYELHLAPHILLGTGYQDLNYRVLVLVNDLRNSEFASRGITEIELRQLGVVPGRPAVCSGPREVCSRDERAEQ